MHWLQLRVDTSAEHAPAVEDTLQTLGAQAVTMEDNADQPIFEPEIGETPLWSDTRVTGLFPADIDSQNIIARAQSRHPEHHMQWHSLEDKDWEREWMASYTPIQVAPKFWICPSWTPPPDTKAVNLLLDPGLAFGTGTHPTTFLCIEWLTRQNLKELHAIDYGCGSGILGIAALLLGAEKVTGTDIDPQALIATKQNVLRNNLKAEQFPVLFPGQLKKEHKNKTVDLVLANILAGPLIELAPQLLSLLSPGGKICLSGILATQESALVDAYKAAVDIEDIKHMDDWICMSGSKRA